MKFTIPKLKVGDVVNADVVEVLGSDTLIVSFNGDLVRVANESPRHFEKGHRIPLQVATTRPLSFKLFRGRVA